MLKILKLFKKPLGEKFEFVVDGVVEEATPWPCRGG